MKRLIPVSRVIGAFLLLALVIAAQTFSGRIDGQIIDFQGKPYPDVTVQIKNADSGQVFTVKTGKDGKFVQIGLRSGIYVITVTNEKDKLNLTEKFGVQTDKENNYVLNLKERAAAAAAAHPEELKKKEEEENKFKNMKAHFEAGVAAMNDADELQKQLRAPAITADQKGPLEEKRTADCQTAATEFQLAEQGTGPKDVNNHITVLGNLATAYECAGHYEDAAGTFQKAIDLKPNAAAYRGLSTNLAKVAMEQSDPKVTEAKLADANAACDKAVALDPASAAPCWKNLGIVLSNKGRLKEAIVPLQKATQMDAKDAQSWFLLGSALTSTIDTKKEGDKEIFIIPPGTAEAYQKCIDAAPNGPYAPQAQAALDGLAQMSGGLETVIAKKKKK